MRQGDAAVEEARGVAGERGVGVGGQELGPNAELVVVVAAAMMRGAGGVQAQERGGRLRGHNGALGAPEARRGEAKS